jgi:hypothetical protein
MPLSATNRRIGAAKLARLVYAEALTSTAAIKGITCR